MSKKSNKAVFLLHGIRDFGGWTTKFTKVFHDHGVTASSRHLGWIGIGPFVVPGQAYSDRRADILKALKHYEGKELTVIAHSFGTWLISQLLLEEQKIKVKRLIFCNAVVPQTFDWDKLKNVEKIIFVCGNQDIWPCAAEIISSRFSATGTRGAQHTRVNDAYFDIGHGGCLNAEFCTQHFLPLVLEGEPIRSQDRTPSRLVSALQYLSANLLLIPIFMVLGFLGYWFTPPQLSCAFTSCFVDITRTEDLRQSTMDGGRFSYVREITQKYSFNYDQGHVDLPIPIENCSTESPSAQTDQKQGAQSAVSLTVYNLLAENPAKRMSYDDKLCRHTYKIPVVNRIALIRLRYESSNAIPEGSAVGIPDLVVRNLGIEILLPAGKSIVPSEEEISKGVFRAYGRLRGEKLKLSVSCDRRVPPMWNESEPYAINCPNIWLLPEGNYLSFRPLGFKHEGDRFLFCFTVSGWAGPDKTKEKGCTLLQYEPLK